MPADPPERIRLSVADARELSECALRGMGFAAEEATIVADHVIDGCLIIAIQTDLLVPLEEFRSQLSDVIAEIKATPRQEGINEIRIPGERAYCERVHRMKAGIEIDRRIYDALGVLAARG